MVCVDFSTFEKSTTKNPALQLKIFPDSLDFTHSHRSQ